MTIQFYWFAPTNGDSRYLGLKRPEREPSLDYLVHIAQVAEQAGFQGILIPTGSPYLDSWLVGAAILQNTRQLRPLVAFRPGFVAPTVAAKQAATLDQWAQGRLALNVVTGGSPYELAQDGDFLEHDRRYERTAEFLEIVETLWSGQTVQHHGDFYHIENGALFPANYQQRRIPLFFGGSSDAAVEVAARYADVYLQWGEPVHQVKEQIERVRQKAAAYGRKLQFGVRFHVIVRETEAEAWAEAERLTSRIDPEVERRLARYYQDADSVAQQRMNDLLQGDYRFGKHLWAGIGRVRKGAGTAIVGSPEQVRETLQEYIEAGVEYFILSGFPHNTEAERFGQWVLPFFRPAASGVVQ